MSFYTALLGKLFSRGVEIELGAGINFAAPLRATPNAATMMVDVSIDGELQTLAPNSSGSALANVEAINAAILRANAASVALTGSVEVLLPAGRYYIANIAALKSNVTLRGAGMGKTVLVMPASAYTNTTQSAYNATSVAISAWGELSGSFTPIENVTICDLTIESEVSDGRYLYPVSLRNVVNGSVLRVEVFGIPTGTLVAVDSVIGGEIAHNWLHDCTSAVVTSLQTTGIQTDDNRANLVASKGLHIHDNTITDLTMTGAALPSANMQTDGIQLGQAVNPARHGHLIHDNYIRNVGEGIDCFSSECTIHSNTLVDCYQIGIKLIHGARRNHVYGNTIMRPGLAGLYLGGSDYVNDGVTGAVEDNYIHDNTVHDVNLSGVFAGSDTAGIRIDYAAQVYKPGKNLIARNRISGGAASMKYAIRQDHGDNNEYIDNWAEAWTIYYSSVGAGTYKIVNAKKTSVRADLANSEATAASVEEIVPFDTEEIDSQSEFNIATDTYTANSHRRLRVCGAVLCGAGGAGETWILRIKKNGTVRAQSWQFSAGVAAQQFVVQDTFSVVPGDTISLHVFQNNGARNIGGSANSTYLTIEEVAG